MADREFRVVVAGAGVSGLFMAETLKRAGIDFTVYEKAGEVGGTWRDNTFPGLFVDVLSRQYEFPFQPNYNWSRKYAPAAEIWAYIKKVARDRGLTKFIRFNEEIVAARFTDGRWHIETARGTADVADVFICATGFLHKPLLARHPRAREFRRPVIPFGALGPQRALRGQALGRHRQRRQRRADHRGVGLGRVRRHPVYPPRAMGPYPREPAFDLARAPQTAAARRLCPRAAPAVAIHQRKRPLAPRARAAARGDGARVSVLSRLHQGPRAEAEAHPRLQSRLHPHPEIGQELLRGGAASQRAHRQGPDRPYRAGWRRDGRRHAGRARRAGLRHRLRCARLYAPDERDRASTA